MINMETQIGSGRREILKDCLASFILQLWTTARKKNKPIRRRELVRIMKQTSTEIRHRYEGPLLADDSRTTLNSLMKCLARVFPADKITMTDFLDKFLGGKPVLDVKTGKSNEPITYDLLTTKQDSFSIWQFVSFQEERKQRLAQSIRQGTNLEVTLQKKFKGTYIFDARKTECTFVPFKKELENILVQAKSKSQDETNNEDKSPESASIQRNDRAAVIILDVEGQFSSQMKALQNAAIEICEKRGIELGTAVEVLNIPYSATLSLKELNLKDLEYFMSKLTVKSRDQFLVALDNIGKNEPLDSAKFFEEVDNEIENNQIIHFSIKKSLNSALLSLKRLMNQIFDVKMKTPLEAERLIEPGKITVVDVAALDDEEKRHVAIYLLAILDRQKREFSNPTRTVLVFDEAHKLFPQTPPKSEKDYVERVNAFVKDIVHRGRKRKSADQGNLSGNERYIRF